MRVRSLRKCITPVGYKYNPTEDNTFCLWIVKAVSSTNRCGWLKQFYKNDTKWVEQAVWQGVEYNISDFRI